MKHNNFPTKHVTVRVRVWDFPCLFACVMKGRGEGGWEWWKQLKSRHSVCRRLKRVGLLSQSGNGWNCVCRTAYKSQCWQYLSMSQTILLGDGNGEMRINSLLLLPSAPIRSFHPPRNPSLEGNMWRETDKYKASWAPPASALCISPQFPRSF